MSSSGNTSLRTLQEIPAGFLLEFALENFSNVPMGKTLFANFCGNFFVISSGSFLGNLPRILLEVSDFC